MRKNEKSNRGGQRKGAGRKSVTGGFETTTLRVPVSVKSDLLALLDIYALKHSQGDVVHRTTDAEKKHAIRMSEELAEFYRTYKKRMAEMELDKRQLELF